MPSTTLTFQFPKHRRHVPTARHRIQKALADWGVDQHLADGVLIAANELVTNSVAHCRVALALIEVTLRLEATELHLSVADPDRDHLPCVSPTAPDDEGGRGLLMVGRLADEWGHRQEPYTKRVWARFNLAGKEGGCGAADL